MDKKKMMLGLGAIGIGVIAYYLYMKSKRDKLKASQTITPSTAKNFANLVVDMGEDGGDSGDSGDNTIEVVDQYSGSRTNIILE